eukprot:1529988-Amphidinium_carterae.2
MVLTGSTVAQAMQLFCPLSRSCKHGAEGPLVLAMRCAHVRTRWLDLATAEAGAGWVRAASLQTALLLAALLQLAQPRAKARKIGNCYRSMTQVPHPSF